LSDEFENNLGHIYLQCFTYIGRVIRVDGHAVPSRRSAPFIIAIYRGEGKPTLGSFLHDLVHELQRLDPLNTAEKPHRRISVTVRAIIADAVMRFFIKNVMSSGGFYACERCQTV
jgi:hypothetical protein